MSKIPELSHPKGWFAACFSNELPIGAVVSRKLFDRDLVLFRTASGEAAAVDAHCPHMGAHFGHGGMVEGETLRCPFHGFRFASDGRCVATPYRTKIPPRCRAGTWPVCERNGVVLLWHHHAGEAPSFAIPEYDLSGWLPLDTRCWTVATHPQETTENSVDMGHFSEVHKYTEVEQVEPLTADGAYLTTSYAMSRPLFGGRIRTRFRVHVHGLGFSHVETRVDSLDVDLRYWVLCTPTEGSMSELRVAGSARLHPGAARLSRALASGASRLIRKIGFEALCHDVSQDFVIWENKRYVDPPILAKGDGPVGAYRKWCRQFYPQLAQIRATG